MTHLSLTSTMVGRRLITRSSPSHDNRIYLDIESFRPPTDTHRVTGIDSVAFFQKPPAPPSSSRLSIAFSLNKLSK